VNSIGSLSKLFDILIVKLELMEKFIRLYSHSKLITAVIVSLLLTSCASDGLDSVRKETAGWDVAKLYAKASEELAGHHWKKAIKFYEVLEATYPYGIYAQQGMLDLAYAYYNSDTPELAIPEIDLFIRTYPTNANMDYALYLKGYINYYNDNGLMASLSRQDLSERDPKGLKDAYDAFAGVVNNYPNSKYAPDSRDKMNKLVNALARGEIFRARHYMQIHAYLAGLNRAQFLIKTYPNTAYVEEALAIQVVAYRQLGELKLSQQTQQVLELNFPHSKYIKQSWEYQDMPWYSFWRS
jgi:outer membrane protein assembly factor BamD